MGFYFCSFGNRLICININRFGWFEASLGWPPVLPHPTLDVFVEPSSKSRQTGKLSGEEAQNDLYAGNTLWHSNQRDSRNVMCDGGAATRRETASQSHAATSGVLIHHQRGWYKRALVLSGTSIINTLLCLHSLSFSLSRPLFLLELGPGADIWRACSGASRRSL